MEESSLMITELHEWYAVCVAELGYPATRVEYEFNEAIRLSPESESAKQNLSRFTNEHKELNADWSNPTKSQMQAIGANEALRPLIAA